MLDNSFPESEREHFSLTQKPRFLVGPLRLRDSRVLFFVFYPISRKLGATVNKGFQILKEHRKRNIDLEKKSRIPTFYCTSFYNLTRFIVTARMAFGFKKQ